VFSAQKHHVRALGWLTAATVAFLCQPAFAHPGAGTSSTSSTAPAAYDSLEDVLRGLDQTGTPKPPPPEETLPPSSASPGEERPLPNYEGREEEAADGGDVLIWAPRIVLFPVHLVLEYGVRWPLVGFITFAEKHYLFDRIVDFFSWDDGNAALFPRIIGDFGLRPSAGASLTWDNFLAEGNNFDATATAWSGDWLNVAAGNSTSFLRDDSARLNLRGAYIRRPDKPFYGIGGRTFLSRESFYRVRRSEGEISLRSFLEGLNRVQFGFAFRDLKFSSDADNPSIGVRHNASLLPGFVDGYQLLHTHLRAEIDTREPDVEFHAGSGLRVELGGSFGFDPSQTDTHFFRYGGEIAGFWDVSGLGHVLAIRLYTELMENSGDNPIPFTELVSLGGAEHMRGFLEDRFLGESAFELTLDYRYPVWSLLDAEVFVSLGNAYEGQFRDFELSHTYLAYGFSLRSNWSREVAVEILLGFGTNRLDSETIRPEFTRFTLGINHGF
jgi:hypothetical protein